MISIRKLVEFSEQFQRGITGIERFNEIMEIEPEIVDKANAIDISDVSGKVEFKNVSFKYESEKTEVLTNLSLTVNPGESIALVGRTREIHIFDIIKN